MPNRNLMLLTLTLLLSGRLPSLAWADILANGDFSKGRQRWSLSQQELARADFTVVDADRPHGGRAARLTIKVNGPPHRLQLSHSFANHELAPGKSYLLTFWARAKQATTLQVLLMNQNKPWENLGVNRVVSLGTKWKPYRFPFRARPSTQPNGKVNFYLGQTRGTLWLADVAIRPYEPKSIEPDGPALETAQWRLRLFKNGALGRLVHKPTGRELIQPSAMPTAYELTLYKSGVSHTITSDQATSITMARLAGESGIRFTARHPGLVVSMVYQVDPNTGLLACRCHVANSSDHAVTRVTFPIITAPEQLGPQSDDDVLLYPAFDGMVIDDPCRVFRRSRRELSQAYPGRLSCQVMAYCDPVAGLYIATHDAHGNPKEFTVAPGFQIRFSITHLAPAVSGQDVACNYPVLVGPFTGDRRGSGTSWRDAADVYRNWAQRQSWAKKKVKNRKDTPDWLRRGALVTTYNPRTITPSGDQTKLEALLKNYQTRFAIPVLANNRGYEHNGMWCGQEYRPVFPDEATFRGSAHVACRLGNQSMIMLSGYRWTIEQTTPEGTLYNSQSRFDREVAPWAVCGPDGKPIIKTSARKKNFHGKRWARMCRGTEYAKDVIVEFAKYCVQNGYSVIHFDQEVSGAYGNSVCYSRDHGHPPGDGVWIHAAMADLYQRICDACRPLDPDFALSMEEPNELYLPWLNLCQERPFGITPEWPVIPPGTRSVPLFLYLYHENLIGWVAFYPWKSGGHPCFSIAKGFTIGQMPGVVELGKLKRGSSEQQQHFLTVLKHCITGYRTFAHDYLVWGRMEHPLPLDVPIRRFRWGLRGKPKQDLVVPAVFHEVWKLDDGRIGVVLVNPEPKSHRLRIDLKPLLGAESEVVVHAQSVSGGQQTYTAAEFQLDVPPLDMLLLEIRRP